MYASSVHPWLSTRPSKQPQWLSTRPSKQPQWLCSRPSKQPQWLCTRPSKQPQRTIMHGYMYTSLQTCLHICFTRSNQETPKIAKKFTSVSLVTNPTGPASLQTTPAYTHPSKQPQRTSMTMYTSLKTTPVYIHGYVHVPLNNPSVHPWLCTRPFKQPQRTIMARYTSFQTCFTFASHHRSQEHKTITVITIRLFMESALAIEKQTTR